MANIYEILSKHFLGEASPEEEKTVSKFERENATEYKALKELWKRGKIEIKDFDSQQSWKQVLSVIKPEKQKHGKVVRLVTRFKRVAAVAAIIIISTFSAYHVWQNINANQELVVQNIDDQNAGEISLSDGTKVWLNKGATLKYPKRFSGNKRNIEL